MGRKKSRPTRAGGTTCVSDIADCIVRNNTEDGECSGHAVVQAGEEIVESSKPFFVDVRQICKDQASDECYDLAEVFLTNVVYREGFSDFKLVEDIFQNCGFSLRLRLSCVKEGSFRLGQWPVISADDIFLELNTLETCESEDKKTNEICSGTFDGSDEGVSGLAHLVSLKFLTLQCSLEDGKLRIRVKILKTAFDACQSLLDTARHPWKRSMMNVMAWLRPEVITQEAKYGIDHIEVDTTNENKRSAECGSKKHALFDAARFYEAIRPSKTAPMLEDEFPVLLPRLRPYQRRAAYWMVQQEKKSFEVSKSQNWFLCPFCVPVVLLDNHSQIFYNPFSGNISLEPEGSSSLISGGILADEMGLGKTVELLACILANPKVTSDDAIGLMTESMDIRNEQTKLKRLKRERVECVCGATTESLKYTGVWVQCDVCDAWQHADCVGFSLKKKRRQSHTDSHNPEIDLTDGSYICSLCSELIQATESVSFSKTTLIVCPPSILSQWSAELNRHTKPDSLKICIYEGVKNQNPSAGSRMGVNELIGADIVLTTYDVLREDLSHDFDRHDGDRRFMRFQKRYPVIPTPLTRIQWWRVCLDEAQMVESNAAAATEMALRLYAQHRWCITGTPIQRRLDDLYGLLRFLAVSPFDTHRWWVEIIRDPYEQGDVCAMEFTHRLFKKIMWRSSKTDVSDELQLPPQEEWISWLTFSQIEAHFYQRQHETCVRDAHEVIGSLKDGTDDTCHSFLSHHEAAKLLNSLLKLRQACCHPQVGSSGLKSLHQSPMTMEEVLEVLVAKAKVEGEEALRKLVVALNGLAGIAAIELDFSRAVSLYKEALSFAEQHAEDFRLDPLLNLHIHYNLAELLPVLTREYTPQSSLILQDLNGSDHYPVKRQKLDSDDSNEKYTRNISDSFTNGMVLDVQSKESIMSLSDVCLRTACENIKQKYLSVFVSKLSLNQQEFKSSNVQVCDNIKDYINQSSPWWLQALDLIEKSKDSSNDLMRKIDEAVSGSSNGSRSSKIVSRFRNMSGLKYLIQKSLDQLTLSRQVLLDRLLEIDKTMENPRDEDIERIRNCRNCYDIAEGCLCIHCELDDLFQVYEARLFRLSNEGSGRFIESAEEAVDLQKKKFALNRFFGTFSKPNRNSVNSTLDFVDNRRKRDVGKNIVVSRSPSEVEIILGVLRSNSKVLLGKVGMSSASRHLLLFEAMRKEYAQARSLSIAQAQAMRAYDEIKMATSRLRLRETECDRAELDTLSLEELTAANVQFSSDKFHSLSLLNRIKGQVRYLKGLVLSEQKAHLDGQNQEDLAGPLEKNVTGFSKSDDESCPVCHEKLSCQKMVFQCGHVTCCGCFVEMMAHKKGKWVTGKWVMCPTCRERTEYGNIGYVDDGKKEVCDSVMPCTLQGSGISEVSIAVSGSYGTKIEAVIRRILWIKSADPEAKVIVFSSWNDVLDVLEHALAANDINYVRMKGGRKSLAAITEFKRQKRVVKVGNPHDQEPQHKFIQVLLLLIQHGANGLNILEAQHVVLVEPLLNPAAEAQAINRVHRIGQENPTFVHRFLVKCTVEESIYQLNRSRTVNSMISGNTKSRNQLVLTLKDVESLFSPANTPEKFNETSGSLKHLPPTVAAALAAERRLFGSR